MTPKDIDSLRLLANNTEHLILMIMTRLKREADEFGHDMSEPYWANGLGNGYGKYGQQWDMYCRKCVYEVDVDSIRTELGEEKIYIEQRGNKKKCPGAR